MTVALTIACAVALALTLRAERRDDTRGRYLFKPLASAAFIAVALAGGALSHALSGYAGWIVAGLVLGAGGDVALMFRGKRSFLVGLVLFLLGHVAYVIACAQVVPMSDWLNAWIAAGVVFGAGVLVYLWPHLGTMRGPVILYVVTIMTMLVGACTVWQAETALSARASALLAAGAVAFVASDVSVARQRFVAPSFVNRAWGLPAYYLGQLLIAWSTIVS